MPWYDPSCGLWRTLLRFFVVFTAVLMVAASMVEMYNLPLP